MSSEQITLQRSGSRGCRFIALITGLFLFCGILSIPGSANAINWPSDTDYSLWINAGVDPAVDAHEDVTAIDLVRYEETTGNFFFYFRIHVRDQQNSQLTSVSHALFLDTDADGTYDYVLYNPTTGAGALELAVWTGTQWSTDPADGGIDYSGLGYTRDADKNDNYIELALPVDDIGDPATMERVSVAGQGAHNLDGNTSNAPDPSQWGDITPTLVNLASFDATVVNGQVVVEWVTDSEIDTIGFHLERYNRPEHSWIRLNDSLLPGMITSPQGGRYTFVDPFASTTGRYVYRLLELESNGNIRVYGPFRATPNSQATVASASAGNILSADKENVLISNKNTGIKGYKRQARFYDTMSTQGAILESTKLDRPKKRNVIKAGGALKIPVTNTGLHFVDAVLIAPLLGITEQDAQNLISEGQLILSNKGKEIPYLQGGSGSELYFYGEAIDSLFTNENMYWLTIGKSSTFLSENTSTIIPPVTQGAFLDITHVEEDKTATPTLFFDPEADFWLWDYIFADIPGLESKDFPFTVTDLDPDTSVAEVSLNLHGASSIAEGNDHHAVIRVNGSLIGETQWKGINTHSVTFSFPSELLLQGTNTLTITGILDAGVSASMFFLDSFDIHFGRLYRALGDRLLLRGDSNQVVQVEGFTGPNIMVLDVSQPDSPNLETMTQVYETAGGYGVRFVPNSPETEYFAVETGSATNVIDAYAGKTSALKYNPGAEWLIIVPEHLLSAASSLADYRASTGLSTMVVDIENVYDEFSYGLRSPQAIKDFLSYAYTYWDSRPKFVVLAGEGSYDYRNLLGNGDCLIPPALIATEFGLFPSDASFGDIDNDNIPEIVVGRLPAMTDAELAGMVAKTVQFDSLPLTSSLMLADNPDDGGKFPEYNESLGSFFPQQYEVTLSSLLTSDTATVKQSLTDHLTEGVHWLTYTGHSGTNQFASEGLLTSAEANSLTNSHYPFVTAFTCFIGNFSYPGNDTLGEVLIVNPSGGAAAVLAASGLSRIFDSALLGELFFESVFAGRNKIAGNALLEVYQNYGSTVGVQVTPLLYSFLGDPAIKLYDNWMVAKQDKRFLGDKGNMYKRQKNQTKVNLSTDTTGRNTDNGF